eukprot:CAMPEP_0198291462 /NCGR_PEP_ID=MMETSP1449-20131203/8983_1 /TAXON_ID=420275 /ORGANISM="Attheya septentrionalis, Strain CCMP2084" /LENGTH=312 /DNA_ID=CAMNT_0043990103 /DNA_START=206 /DNA_END=1142 /DNA_ORIENTATION=+
MLAADKLQLQSSLKQQATALKEKEFTLHHSNLMTVGTQAAVLAGLDVTMFIEFNPPDNAAWGALEMWARALKFFYYVFITVAFCCNILVVSQTTLLSVMGAGLALRGPDGSMMTATDGLYEERKSVFAAFAYGLATTVASVVLCVWLILSWEAALVCMSISIYTGYIIYANYKRIAQRFDFDESQTVTFHDIFDDPPPFVAYPPTDPTTITPPIIPTTIIVRCDPDAGGDDNIPPIIPNDLTIATHPMMFYGEIITEPIQEKTGDAPQTIIMRTWKRHRPLSAKMVVVQTIMGHETTRAIFRPYDTYDFQII